MRWVDKYKSTNNITRKKRDYTAYKISNSHISFIKHQLGKKIDVFLDKYQEEDKDVILDLLNKTELVLLNNN